MKGVTGIAHPWMSATPGDPACLEHARAHLEPVYTWFRAQPAKTSPPGAYGNVAARWMPRLGRRGRAWQAAISPG